MPDPSAQMNQNDWNGAETETAQSHYSPELMDSHVEGAGRIPHHPVPSTGTPEQQLRPAISCETSYLQVDV